MQDIYKAWRMLRLIFTKGGLHNGDSARSV